MKTCFDGDADSICSQPFHLFFTSMKICFAYNAECIHQKTQKNLFIATHSSHENTSLTVMQTECRRTMAARIQSTFIWVDSVIAAVQSQKITYTYGFADTPNGVTLALRMENQSRNLTRIGKISPSFLHRPSNTVTVRAGDGRICRCWLSFGLGLARVVGSGSANFISLKKHTTAALVRGSDAPLCMVFESNLKRFFVKIVNSGRLQRNFKTLLFLIFFDNFVTLTPRTNAWPVTSFSRPRQTRMTLRSTFFVVTARVSAAILKRLEIVSQASGNDLDAILVSGFWSRSFQVIWGHLRFLLITSHIIEMRRVSFCSTGQDASIDMHVDFLRSPVELKVSNWG